MRRYELLYKSRRKERDRNFYSYRKKVEKGNLPLIHSFLNKRVRVKVDDGLTVEGTLVYCQLGSKTKPHRPNVLILKSRGGVCLLRGNFQHMAEVRQNG
jgi:hypothetical protein